VHESTQQPKKKQLLLILPATVWKEGFAKTSSTILPIAWNAINIVRVSIPLPSRKPGLNKLRVSLGGLWPMPAPLILTFVPKPTGEYVRKFIL